VTGTGPTAASAPPAPARLEPPLGAESGPFWEATREERLLVQWCSDCDRGVFYPRAVCPHCGGRSGLEWREASGRATVYAATVEHRPAPGGFSGGEPYCVALVDLHEGVRMMTNIVGCPPADARSGMAVVVTWEPLTDGRKLPLFRPADDDGARGAAP
jgi:uncharacterized OB-fold protein